MKEWEYVRLMNRNYLQVQVIQESIEDLFQYRMMISGPIKGLLGCRLRELNGMDFLLYDISSMQNLCSLYVEKKMDFSAFYQLIYCLQNTVKNMKQYLLEEEHLCLYPEFIFQELETKEYNFVYYPGGIRERNDSGNKLYEFLLTVVDHEDASLTEIIYQSYEYVTEQDDSAWIEYVGKKLQQELENRNNVYSGTQIEELQQSDEEKLFLSVKDFIGNALCDNEEIIDFDSKKERKRVETKKIARILIAGIIYMVAVGFGIFYLYSNYILDLQENIITWAALIIATSLLAFWMFVWIKKRDYNVSEKNSIELKGYEESFDLTKTHPKESEERNIQREDYGKTIFFETEEIENKLYGIGKRNRRIIKIDKFPFVIGKKEDCVDGILDDASISRVHARFFQRDSVLCVEDLNSTNGTYKNGIMLAPHEKAEVFPEDEIRFGKLQFIYR